MDERYITDGITAVPFYGKIVPKGLREITEPEYRQMLALRAQEDQAYIDASNAALRALRDAAKAKLVAGEPLTAEEADALIG